MRASVALLLLMLAGCAGNQPSPEQERTSFDACRNGVPEDPDASLRFADSRYELAWQRRCDNGGTRVFRQASGSDSAEARLVTLTRYPPDAGVEATLDAYLARSASERVGEPQIFQRGSGGSERYIAELMLRREDAGHLEYILHGVTRGRGDRVISVTYTHRFDADGDAGLERIKADQATWVGAIERHLAAFPPP